MKNFALCLMLTILTWSASCRAGENPKGETPLQAEKATQPEVEKRVKMAPLRELPPDLLDYLRKEAAKAGLHLKTTDDFRSFFRQHKWGYANLKEDNTQEALMWKIDFVFTVGMTPTKENCMKVIQEPERRDGHHVFLRRGAAFSWLEQCDWLTADDLPMLKESFSSARYCQSMIGALCAIAKLNRDEGLAMAREFLMSDNYPTSAKINLLWDLNRINCEDVLRYKQVIAEGALQRKNAGLGMTRALFYALALQIAHAKDNGVRESKLKTVAEIFDQAEKEAAETKRNLEELRTLFQKTLETEEQRKEKSRKKEDPSSQGQ